jgi:predicted PurR-regulated permease PerM
VTAETNSQSRLGAALFYGIVGLLAILVFQIAQPFLAPLAWAAVLAVVSQPWHQQLEQRWGRTWAASASTAIITLILVVPTIFLAIAFFRQGIVAAHSAQEAFAKGQLDWVNRGWVWLQARLGASPLDIATVVRQQGENVAGYLAGALGNVLRNAARFMFDLLVMLFAMFYLFRDGPAIVVGFRHLLPFEEEHRERIISEAHELIFATVTSGLVAAALQGLVGGTAFAIAGISAPIFWGVAMALLSLLPIVGSSIIWLPAALGLLLQGRFGGAILIVVASLGVVTLVENILRPWLISGRAQLSGLVVFISVLGGISVFGVLGIVLGPIVIATAVSVLDIYRAPASPHRDPRAAGRNAKAVLE